MALSSDASTRFDTLTQRQRECLRLVYGHHSSKEIARILKVEPPTVDQHIKTAMHRLGVTSRFAAAQLLAQHEGPSPKSVYPILDVANKGESRPPSLSQDGSEGRPSGPALRENRTAFDVDLLGAGPDATPSSPSLGRRGHDLNIFQRLGLIGLIAIGSALAFGALLSGLDALTRLT